MSVQRCKILPLFKENQAVSIFSVDRDAVAYTAGFGSGSGNVFLAELQHLVATFFATLYLAPHDDHLGKPVVNRHDNNLQFTIFSPGTPNRLDLADNN